MNEHRPPFHLARKICEGDLCFDRIMSFGGSEYLCLCYRESKKIGEASGRRYGIQTVWSVSPATLASNVNLLLPWSRENRSCARKKSSVEPDPTGGARTAKVSEKPIISEPSMSESDSILFCWTSAGRSRVCGVVSARCRALRSRIGNFRKFMSRECSPKCLIPSLGSSVAYRFCGVWNHLVCPMMPMPPTTVGTSRNQIAAGWYF